MQWHEERRANILKTKEILLDDHPQITPITQINFQVFGFWSLAKKQKESRIKSQTKVKAEDQTPKAKDLKINLRNRRNLRM